jgi:NAD(P)-dependent dehydrogenase (short-subunit alcohol dehydrogenase family)
MIDLANRVVLITGAAGNLGAAVAMTLSELGARCVLVGRAEESLRLALPDLADEAQHRLVAGIDLASEESAQAMAARALEHFERIDALVNTVGGFRGGTTVLEDEADDWTTLFSLNVLTARNAARAVLPTMLRQRRGAIVNVASPAALAAPATLAAYSASKAALVRLTEALAAETRAYGLNVNCVLPTTLDTPTNRAAMPGADPAGWVKPQAVAAVIAFLVSDSARAISGAAIPLTAGG